MQENSQEVPKLELSASLNYETKGDERLMAVLYKKIEDLDKKVTEVQQKQLLSELPREVIEENGLLPEAAPKFKRGRGYRPLLQSEIEEVKKQSPVIAQQARILGVHPITVKKYSLMYGIYEPCKVQKGIRRMFDPERGKFPLSKILNGEFRDNPAVSAWMVKDKLIRSGTFPPKCNICGYDKRRITDKKIGLLLDHKDGDRRNFNLENLQLLCLNCTFECGRGYIRRGNHTFDVDWMQGADIDHIDSQNRW